MSVRNIEREMEMVRLYAGGMTIEAVATQYGISKNRTWLLLQRHADVARAGRLESKCQQRYGCDYATAKAICEPLSPFNERSVAYVYSSHKRGAHHRGIGWEFTLPEWFAVWKESGHWADRGCGVSKYVMARRGDCGPYSPSNVYITTCAQNGRDAIANGRFTPFIRRAA